MKADGPKISNLMVHEFESERFISMRVSGSKSLYLSFKIVRKCMVLKIAKTVFT